MSNPMETPASDQSKDGNAASAVVAGSAPRCQITCGEYPGYYKCDRPAKFVTDGSKPPGKLFACGIHARSRFRTVTPLPNSKAIEPRT